MFLILSLIDNILLKFFLVLILAVYSGYCLMILSEKNGKPGRGWSFVPIFNLFILIGAAKKPYWYFLLLLIPLVDIVVMIYLWMEIARLRNHPSWLGILIIIPFGETIIPGYLAFVDKGQPILPKQPQQPQQPQQL